MSTSNVNVNIQYFSDAYLDKADKVFLHPSPKYLWNEIISGTLVRSQTGGTRKMFAVAQNTFRGFHRVNKACPGAKEGFINYFLSQHVTLIQELSSVNTIDDLKKLSNNLCEGIRTNLSNCSSTQLKAYNKVRKPVDLYIEHLVAMAVELGKVRARLVPLLFLPIDSQILAYQGIFTDHELNDNSLSRGSTYRDVTSERAYLALQALLSQKAMAISEARHRPFHCIYFDLIWNERHKNWGGNLFETNP